MTRPVICQGCREKFIREDGNYIKDTKGFYHTSCHQKMLASRAAREDLLQYCFMVLGKDMNPALVQKQIKEMTTKYRYTESGIKGTLYYLHEIKKMRLNAKMGIAIVPYHYDKARLYFEKVESTTDLPSMEDIVETREITISKPQNNKRYSRIVSLEDMFEEGEI